MDPEKSTNITEGSVEEVPKKNNEKSVNQLEMNEEENVSELEKEVCAPTNPEKSEDNISPDSSKNTEPVGDESKNDRLEDGSINSDENESANVSTSLIDSSKTNEKDDDNKDNCSEAEIGKKSSEVVEEILGTSSTNVSKDTDDKESDKLVAEKELSENVTEKQTEEQKNSEKENSEETEKSESSKGKINEKLTETVGEPDEQEGKETEKEKNIIENEEEKDENEKVCDSSTVTTGTNVQDKDETQEKNAAEPENTEFVQISQDKQDDSQNEGQSIEAEDPFGGDNLAADTVESMETDDINERSINFSELDDQADNLQDVVNAKSSGESTKDVQKTTDSSNVSVPTETSDIIDITQEEKEKSSEVSSESQDVETKEAKTSEDKETQEKIDEKDENKEDSGDDIMAIESSNEEQSTVLPGQDDELCIVPDTMKIVLPEKTTARIEETKDNGKNKNEGKDKKKDGGKVMKISVRTESNLIATEKTTESKKSGGITVRTTKSVIDSGKSGQIQTSDKTNEIQSIEITDDVIDVEEARTRTGNQELNIQKCKQCNEENICTIKVKIGPGRFSVCSRTCQELFLAAHGKATDIPSDGVNSKYEKRCACCLLIVETDDERNLAWETMEFCNEECLGKFQTKYGSYCRNCNGTVQSISLGKYCVRFGYDVRQFCCSTCLEEFKKGLKVCSYCQKDISSGTDGFLAPVGDKGQFKDFCTQHCMEKYSRMNSTEPPSIEKKACSVCQEQKIVHCEVAIDRGSPQAMCSEPCFAAFKFVNKVDPDQCSTCKKYFEVVNKKNTVVFYNNEPHTFCSKSCLNIFIITNRKIVPCNWCKVKKYNFDMIKKELKTGQIVMMCSLNCLTLYQVSIQAVSARRVHCDLCKEFSQAQYHLTMSDATIRNFCSYNCVMKFQGQYTKSPITIPTSGEITSSPVPTGMPKRTIPVKLTTQTTTKKATDMQNITLATNIQNIQPKKTMPVISSVSSLAPIPTNGQTTSSMPQKITTTVNNPTITTSASVGTQSQVIYKQQVITRPVSPVTVHNKMTQCKPLVHTKGVSARPHPCAKSTQTDEVQKILIPIPVPIYVPFPVHMFSFPVPVPMPFPIPIPVPIFIPTTRNSSKGIMKEIKKIQEKMPSDPFEAELVMMAGMVATEKKENESESDSSSDEAAPETLETENIVDDDDDDDESNEVLENCNLDLALEITSGNIPEPAVDLEAALASNTITAPTLNPEKTEIIISDAVDSGATDDSATQGERRPTQTTKGKKRAVSSKSKSTPNKRGRKLSVNKDSTSTVLMPPPTNDVNLPSTPNQINDPVEKPDANMALKYTFGVNAWRQWVANKNIELEKQDSSAKKVKLFKTELLQLTADELNYSLCLFVKEVRKPNGAEYAPDTIYYLCLGIQQYLFENNRIDNIFTDTYYEKFTDCLNDIAKKFSVLYNEAQYIVTRVEEEHLWECKQLGAHSPHVLLSTLMFFNTKHFNLTSVEEHMQLSFSHIMKHWKRNQAAQNSGVAGKAPGSRNVLLRFYPPQSALEANSKKKKVYEQQENEENPLRCPVKLYEFYLSKCPESVKTRNDVFYLLPERSCVPDSPVWYSTSPLAEGNLVKMLNRVKIVKEINVSLLSS